MCETLDVTESHRKYQKSKRRIGRCGPFAVLAAATLLSAVVSATGCDTSRVPGACVLARGETAHLPQGLEITFVGPSVDQDAGAPKTVVVMKIRRGAEETRRRMPSAEWGAEQSDFGVVWLVVPEARPVPSRVTVRAVRPPVDDTR